MNIAVRVDRSSGHGTTRRHGPKEAIDHVVDSQKHQLLTLVNVVVVLQTKGLADAQMLHRHGNQRRKRPGHDFLQQRGIVVLRGRQAVGIDLGHSPEELILAAARVVAQIRDEGEDDEDNDGAARGNELEVLVLPAPSLAYLFKGHEGGDAGEADAQSQWLYAAQVSEDVMYNLRCAGRGVEADEGANLAEANDQSNGGDPAREHWGRHKVEKEAELEESNDQRIDADHEGDG